MSKILVTGATGFLGSYILKSLDSKGFEVLTLGRSSGSIVCDLSNEIPVLDSDIDFVIHVAGLAHKTPNNSSEEYEFNRINVIGTINLTKGFGSVSPPKSIVYISSVAVYGDDHSRIVTEEDELVGKSAYARSKIEAERYLAEWCTENEVLLTILRLPLIAGADPPGNLGRMINAIRKGYYVRIGKGNARKSLVLASDVAAFIPSCQGSNGIYNLTDQVDPTVRELELSISSSINRKVRAFPIWIFRILAIPSRISRYWPVSNDQIDKLTSSLTFSSSKATKELGWKPSSVIDYFRTNGL